MSGNRQSETGFQKRRTLRWKKRHLIIAGLLILLGLGLFAVPTLIQNRDLAIGMINRNAGLAPMRIDLEALEIGWLRPAKIHGLRLIDDRGAELVQVGEIETELSLLSLAWNYRNLRTITIRDAQVLLDVQPGTTNLEEAIKPLLYGASRSSEITTTSSASTSSSFSGRLRVTDAIIHARDSVDRTAWDIRIAEAEVPMPTAEQPFPPMTLVGQLTQIAALPGEAPVGGQFTVRTQAIDSAHNPDGVTGLAAMRMSVSTAGLPLQWISLVKRRIPDLPIERMIGQATLQAEVEFPSANSLVAMIQTAQLDNLQVIAPNLLGPRGAQMRQIKLSGDLHMTPNRIGTRGSKLECDIGSVIAKADLAWPLPMPTLAKPWLEDSELDIQGTVSLPQLTRVAPDLIRTQDQVELISGVANLTAVQRRTPRTDGASQPLPPTTNYQLQLGQLQANVQGKSIRWDQALHASVSVIGADRQLPSFKIDCDSEFCKIDGAGDLHDGRVTAQLDLDKMEQRLSQWFVLPLESLSGSAQASIAWKLDEGNRLAANGSLRTTPLRIVHRNGLLDEPAWDGDFSTVARVDGVSILQIDRSQLSLKSADESLIVQILEPISLASNNANIGAMPPAGMQLKFVGEMSRWQRRGQLFAGLDLGMQLAGNCSLDAFGGVDIRHLEITKADFTMEPFQISSNGTTFQESRMVGKFAGRIDTNDIARTQVDSLLLQSESFALQAQDTAIPGQSLARDGQAAFRIAPNRLMSSVQFDSPQGVPQANTISVTGDVTGQIHWTIDPKAVNWQLVTDAANIRALQMIPRPANQLVSTAATAPGESILWEEPQVRCTIDGQYAIPTGQITLPRMQLQSEWLAYGGEATVNSSPESMSIVSRGDVTYDAASVAQRMRPFIGTMLVIEGQRTQPLSVSWKSTPKASWADALQVESSIGWDRANIVGVEIGRADVPLSIQNGRFVSQTSFPVSQGTLRWNLDGDLTATPMVIRQAPERVIENVAITKQMCQGWLKFVAPLLADVTQINGNLSLDIERAEFMPTDLAKQTVAGQLHVLGANVGPGPLADQLLGLVQQIRNLKKGLGATENGGQASSWLQLPEQSIGFTVEQGRVIHRNMQIQAGDVVMVTSGSVGVDGSLELVASVPILKEWLDKAPSLQSLAGQQLQIPIRGTMQRPQLDFSSLTAMTQQLATSALQGAAQKQIDRGLNKLLGPLQNQLGPFQQGVQQMQQGVQQNLQGLPLPNLPIPGFGPGPFGGSQPAVPPPSGTAPPTIPNP